MGGGSRGRGGYRLPGSGQVFRQVPRCIPLFIHSMMFYPTIGSTYFVKTQTYVALFCPHELSIIFSGVMYLELSPL